MTVNDYKLLEDLEPEDIDLLRQVYVRLRTEGYEPGYGFADFFDIVIGRNGEYGDHSIVPDAEQTELNVIGDPS